MTSIGRRRALRARHRARTRARTTATRSIIRGNSSSADFFLDGVRDDVQYYRDLYNLERVEALKGPNAMIFGRGGGGGVDQPRDQGGRLPARCARSRCRAARYGNKRVTADLDQPLDDKVALPAQRHVRELRQLPRRRRPRALRRQPDPDLRARRPRRRSRSATSTSATRAWPIAASRRSRAGRPTSTLARSSATPTTATCGPASTSAPRPSSTSAGAVTIRNRTLFGDYDRFYQNFVPGRGHRGPERRSPSRAYNNATERRNVFNQTDVIVRRRDRTRPPHAAGGRRGRPPGHRQLPQHRLLQQHRHLDLRSPFADAHDRHAGHASARARPTPTTTCAPTWPPPTCRTRSSSRRSCRCSAGVRFDRFDLAVPQQPQRRHPRPRRRPRLAARGHRLQAGRRRVSVYGSYSVSYLPSSGDQFSSLTTITQQVEPEKFTQLRGRASSGTCGRTCR